MIGRGIRKHPFRTLSSSVILRILTPLPHPLRHLLQCFSFKNPLQGYVPRQLLLRLTRAFVVDVVVECLGGSTSVTCGPRWLRGSSNHGQPVGAIRCCCNWWRCVGASGYICLGAGANTGNGLVGPGGYVAAIKAAQLGLRVSTLLSRYASSSNVFFRVDGVH